MRYAWMRVNYLIAIAIATIGWLCFISWIEADLVDLPSTPRDHQLGHHEKTWAPDRRHPKNYGFYRVHARPRHDRLDEVCLDSLDFKAKTVVRCTKGTEAPLFI